MLGVILVCAEAALGLNHFKNNIDVKFWPENSHVRRNGVFYDYCSSILKCSLDVIEKLSWFLALCNSLTLLKKFFNRIITHIIDIRVCIKIGSIKDRNGMDLTEAEDNKIIRRGGKNTQNNYTKKIFMTQIFTMVWSFTKSQTFWNVSQVGLRKHHYKQI